MENKNRSSRRQAVVIIHGMGEQAPMVTLRGFVQGITAWIKNFDDTLVKPRCWSRPDSISELYETRKITMEAFDGNLKTDFYEFYWAHHMRDTSFSHLFAWVKAVAFTPVKKVPPRLKIIWWSFWAISCLLAIGAGLAFANKMHIETLVAKYWKHTALLALLLLIVKWVFPNVIMNFVKEVALDYAGDVARYLNPKTYNIEERSSIRREGINFLKKLHERTEKKYEKIIVVGHSLGSVVAYDLVRLLW